MFLNCLAGKWISEGGGGLGRVRRDLRSEARGEAIEWCCDGMEVRSCC